MKEACGWSGPLPLVGGAPQQCVTCGLMMNYGKVRRCQVNERSVPSTKSPAPMQKQEPVRLDWAAEYPCLHRGEQQDQQSCGCGGVDKVPVYVCLEKPDTQCVVLKSNQLRLVRKDSRKWVELRACEGCPFAKVENPPNLSESGEVSQA